MWSEDVLLRIGTHYYKSFVFPISAFMVNYSRWRSDSDSGDDGYLEKVIDLSIKTSNLLLWPWGRSLRTVIQFWMQGFLDFEIRNLTPV